jgi:LysR family nitrogen assimilation transcriptional regulator
LIEFRQLKYFVKIVEAGSLTRASALLHIAQPALSQQMADFERSVGVPLLLRSVKGVTPTVAGQAVYRHAQMMLHMREQTIDVARGAAHQISGRVRLGLPSSIAMILAAPLVAFLRKKHPEILLELYESPSAYLAAQLFDERVDLSLLVDQIQAPGLSVEPLLDETVYFVQANSSKRPTQRQSVQLTDLSNTPMIFTTRATTLRQILDSACDVAKVQINVQAEASSIQTLLTVVAQGELATLVPYSALSWMPTTRALRLLPLKPHVTRTLSMASSRSANTSAAVNAVRQTIQEVAASLDNKGVWLGATLHQAPV